MADEPEEPQPVEETPPEEESAEGRGRLSRLRFSKKKDMPGGLWLKCESCGQMIYRKELDARARTCPACGFHFTLPGRQRIETVVDEGTWEERFADVEPLDRLEFVDKIPYSEKLSRTADRVGQKEALLCGLGTIRGRPVVLTVLDFSFLGGSMGEVVGEKIALAADLARIEERPLVLFTSSGGARMHEGALSLMQMAKTCSAIQSLHEAGGFSVCVMTHPTTGGVTASFASICDVTLAEPGALIGFAGPRVIATTLKQELPPGFQRAEFLLEKGMIDAIVSRDDLRATLSRLLDYGTGARVESAESAATTEVPRADAAPPEAADEDAARADSAGAEDVPAPDAAAPSGEGSASDGDAPDGGADATADEPTPAYEIPDKFVPFDEDELT